MKKFSVVLLSLALVLAFSLPVFAASGDFSGHLRWRGWYADNPTMRDKNAPTTSPTGSSAFIEQRLRLGTSIKLEDGVVAYGRADILENFWQGTVVSGGSNELQTNVQFDAANMTFALPFGKFLVGFTNAPLGYGTRYWESGEGIRPVIRFTTNYGPIEYRVTLEKKAESQQWGNGSLVAPTDADSDIYALGGKYKGKGFEAGMQWQYLVDNSKRPGFATPAAPNVGFSTKLHALTPYVIAKLGNLDLQAELLYVGGKAREYDEPRGGQDDVKASGFGGYLNAVYTMGPAQLGFAASYTKGDDPNTRDKMEGGFSGLFDGASSEGGSSSNKPTTMLVNTSWNNFFGAATSSLSTADKKNVNVIANSGNNTIGASNDNMLQLSLFGYYDVTKKLQLYSIATMYKAETKPYNSTVTAAAPNGTQFISDDIGKELDFSLFYKITSQLTYNVQACYFWTGDYFKGTNAAAKVDNNYILMHALLLEF